jgi:Uma2 family endonuclease
MEQTVTTYHGLKMTAEEYFGLPDDGRQYELIDGVLHMVPSPLTFHQKVSIELAFLLMAFVKQHSLGEVYDAPLDVHLSGSQVYQPDLIFISREREAIITRQRIEGAPDLVIEILSPGSADRDRGVKMQNYARYGVREFWLVDPETRRFEFYVGRGGRFEAVEAEEGVYKSTVVKGWELDIATFWEAILT